MMTELENVEYNLYLSLCRMYTSMLERGRVGRIMIETTYNIERGGLERWVNEKVGATMEKAKAVQARSGQSTPVQSVG